MRKTKRVLILIHSLQAGGAERVATSLANYWAKKNWNVTVATLTNATNDFYKLDRDVTRIELDLAEENRNILNGIFHNIRRIYSLRKLLSQHSPDVALAMMSNMNILLALASYGVRDTVILGSERSYPPRMPLGRAWEILRTFAYARLDAVITLTEETALWIKRHTRCRCTHVIPNAVAWPLPHLSPYLPPPRRCKNKFRLLAVGRLNEEKGFDSLISIFARLSEEFAQWELVIVGDGPMRAELQAQSDAAGLSDRIKLVGRVGNIGDWYKSADLYALSSRFEGFPNTLIEAMAHGLPAVSFDCNTGPRDIIRDQVDGLLIPAGNMCAMESALRKLMGDKCLRESFSKEAREVRKRFSLQRISEMWSDTIEELSNLKHSR